MAQRVQPGRTAFGHICGMALEPLMSSLDDDNPELRDFSRRFWRTLPFTLAVFVPANMWRLIGIGVGSAFIYSVSAAVVPQ